MRVLGGRHDTDLIDAVGGAGVRARLLRSRRGADPRLLIEPGPGVVIHASRADTAGRVTATDERSGVWAQVTATPLYSTFDGGNGDQPVLCDGPGLPWRHGLPENPPGACAYSYQRPAEALTATVTSVTRLVPKPATSPMNSAVKAKSAPMRSGSPRNEPRIAPTVEDSVQFAQSTTAMTAQ